MKTQIQRSKCTSKFKTKVALSAIIEPKTLASLSKSGYTATRFLNGKENFGTYRNHCKGEIPYFLIYFSDIQIIVVSLPHSDVKTEEMVYDSLSMMNFCDKKIFFYLF